MGSWGRTGSDRRMKLCRACVLISSGVQPSGGQNCWSKRFLPSVFQGVQCRSKGDPVL